MQIHRHCTPPRVGREEAGQRGGGRGAAVPALARGRGARGPGAGRARGAQGRRTARARQRRARARRHLHTVRTLRAHCLTLLPCCYPPRFRAPRGFRALTQIESQLKTGLFLD